MDVGAPVEPLYYYNLALLLLVGLVAYFLKRLVGVVDNLQKEVANLKCDVCVIIDRDRRQRLEDYRKNYNGGEEEI